MPGVHLTTLCSPSRLRHSVVIDEEGVISSALYTREDNGRQVRHQVPHTTAPLAREEVRDVDLLPVQTVDPRDLRRMVLSSVVLKCATSSSFSSIVGNYLARLLTSGMRAAADNPGSRRFLSRSTTPACPRRSAALGVRRRARLPMGRARRASFQRSTRMRRTAT